MLIVAFRGSSAVIVEPPAALTLRRRLVRFSAGHGVILDLVGLILCAALVHLVYLFYIDPVAGDAIRAATAEGAVPERNLAVILKDLEQEICLVIGLWCAWLLAFRYRLLESEGYLLELDFLQLDAATDASQATLEGLGQRLAEAAAKVPNSLLLESLGLAFDRIRLNGDFHEANEVASEACDLHLETLYAKLAITRYVLWAIPSIGFLGTVRGIGEALTKAGEAMAGDISGVAASLGIAFNSTFVALFVSLVLMLVSSLLQGREERLVANCKHFISSRVIAQLSALAKTTVVEGAAPASTKETGTGAPA